MKKILLIYSFLLISTNSSFTISCTSTTQSYKMESAFWNTETTRIQSFNVTFSGNSKIPINELTYSIVQFNPSNKADSEKIVTTFIGAVGNILNVNIYCWKDPKWTNPTNITPMKEGYELWITCKNQTITLDQPFHYKNA